MISKVEAQKLEKLRSFEVGAGQLADLIIYKLDLKQTPSEWVEREERDELLTSKSRSTSNHILTWGKKNGFPVEKRGAMFWKRSDLIKLADEYWKVN